MGVVLTPFGGLKYGDDKALRDWAFAHEERHRLYEDVAHRQSEQLELPPLMGKINADWFGRHLLVHVGLMMFLPEPATTGTDPLRGWDDAQSFYSWHDLHTLLHRQLDDALGLT